MAPSVHQLMSGCSFFFHGDKTGSADIETMRTKTQFSKITGAGMRESQSTIVTITKEAPNYPRAKASDNLITEMGRDNTAPSLFTCSSTLLITST